MKVLCVSEVIFTEIKCKKNFKAETICNTAEKSLLLFTSAFIFLLFLHCLLSVLLCLIPSVCFLYFSCLSLCLFPSLLITFFPSCLPFLPLSFQAFLTSLLPFRALTFLSPPPPPQQHQGVDAKQRGKAGKGQSGN